LSLQEQEPTLPGRVVGGALAGTALLSAYLYVVRPRQLTWGATDEEVERPMPGDEIVERPGFNATRAVTIGAQPEEVWPWIVQIGYGRAGWYTYDWIDNLGHPSADSIVPELQRLEVGDLIPIFDGYGFVVSAMEPDRWMLWEDQQRERGTSWLWMLDPADGDRTRLITRVRMRHDWRSPKILFSLLIDLADNTVMMRKCMLGIKERAEALREEFVFEGRKR
jgi:hypothetical protein